MQTAFAAFIQAASRDDRSDGAFNTQMHALLDATNEIHEAQTSLASQPGAAHRELFAKSAVMCQRSAILFWQRNSSMDMTPGHFYQPPTNDIVSCTKTLADPDSE